MEKLSEKSVKILLYLSKNPSNEDELVNSLLSEETSEKEIRDSRAILHANGFIEELSGIYCTSKKADTYLNSINNDNEQKKISRIIEKRKAILQTYGNVMTCQLMSRLISYDKIDDEND